jgi:hypothetical protein
MFQYIPVRRSKIFLPPPESASRVIRDLPKCARMFRNAPAGSRIVKNAERTQTDILEQPRDRHSFPGSLSR